MRRVLTVKLAPMTNFPHDQGQRVHIHRLERFKVPQIQAAIEDFRGQVADRAEFLLRWNIQETGSALIPHRQAQVGNHALAVPFDQNVFRLQVAMGNRRFT